MSCLNSVHSHVAIGPVSRRSTAPTMIALSAAPTEAIIFDSTQERENIPTNALISNLMVLGCFPSDRREDGQDQQRKTAEGFKATYQEKEKASLPFSAPLARAREGLPAVHSLAASTCWKPRNAEFQRFRGGTSLSQAIRMAQNISRNSY